MSSPAQILSSLLHFQQSGKVKFILKGSAKDYNITYKCNEEKAHHLDHERKNWHYSFSAQKGDYIFFLAQANEPGATVHVKILYNGKIFKESTVSGDFALAYGGGCLC